MKLRSYLWILTIWLITTAVSCNKCDQDNITRPDLTTDEFKWVTMNDTAPFFKITTFYTNGDTVTDTIQGKYSLTIEEKQNDVDDCYSLYYKTYTNQLSLPYEDTNFGENFIVDNYDENGFKGSFGGVSPYLTKTTSLDTITVNGKLYNNVFIYNASSIYTFYYAKSIGFIYKRKNHSLNVEKQRTEIVLIP